MATSLKRLSERGQSVWIDYLSRSFVRDGELERLVQEGVEGVTSNPTIFQGAIAEGEEYDEQLREVLQSVSDPKEVFLALAKDDIRDACALLRGVFDRGGKTRDGWVSLEVDPTFAYKEKETLQEAKRLHAMIDRPNLFVKIPGTEPGLTAIEESIAAGIPINVTLLFSLQRHRETAQAYIRGLRRLRDAGGDLSSVASVASFFVSRVDSEADKRLDQIGGHDELKGTLAIANAKLAYQTYKEIFAGDDWAELEAAGASPQRCLWASTSTKNPAVPRRHLRRGADRARDGQHDAARDDQGVRGSRRGRGLARGRRRRRAAHRSTGSRRPESTTTTSSRCSSARASRSSSDSFRELLDGVAGKRDQLVAA